METWNPMARRADSYDANSPFVERPMVGYDKPTVTLLDDFP